MESIRLTASSAVSSKVVAKKILSTRREVAGISDEVDHDGFANRTSRLDQCVRHRGEGGLDTNTITLVSGSRANKSRPWRAVTALTASERSRPPCPGQT